MGSSGIIRVHGTVHRLASHTHNLNRAVLTKMKAFVAVVAALCASAKAQYPFYAPYSAGYGYGYSNINSAKHEVGNAYGGVTGSYSYVDANGVLQTTNYIADGLGFRVVASNLPVAPAAPEVAPLEAPVFNLEAPVYTGVAPSPVEDTPEVKAAKAEFQAAFDEAASRTKRSTPAAPLPLAYGGFAHPGFYGHPGFYAHAPAAPLAYAAAPAPAAAIVPSAPATREAVLTKIQLNPGHATAYRVD